MFFEENENYKQINKDFPTLITNSNFFLVKFYIYFTSIVTTFSLQNIFQTKKKKLIKTKIKIKKTNKK